MILTRKAILKLVDEGKLTVEPFRRSQVGPASIDLRLGHDFRTFRNHYGVIKISDGADYRDATETVVIKRGALTIRPMELIHGITAESISLPPDIAGRIEGRSRFARLGLLVHLSSGFVVPGSKGKIVLEITNLSPSPLALHPGTKVCQLILEKADPPERYRGRFSNQSKP